MQSLNSAKLLLLEFLIVLKIFLIALLKSKNIPFEELDVWQDPNKAKEMLQRTNGAKTIPQIFIGDHYVGTNEQLQTANQNGELDKLLA